jgi:hypothetical protein
MKTLVAFVIVLSGCAASEPQPVQTIPPTHVDSPHSAEANRTRKEAEDAREKTAHDAEVARIAADRPVVAQHVVAAPDAPQKPICTRDYNICGDAVADCASDRDERARQKVEAEVEKRAHLARMVVVKAYEQKDCKLAPESQEDREEGIRRHICPKDAPPELQPRWSYHAEHQYSPRAARRDEACKALDASAKTQ